MPEFPRIQFRIGAGLRVRATCAPEARDIVQQAFRVLSEKGLRAEIAVLEKKPIESVAQAKAALAWAKDEAARAKPVPKTLLTYQQVGEAWTSGDLHRQFPDQVSAIFQDFNVQRLKRHVYPVIGAIPIREVTRANCDEVMRRLPERVKSRRHIATLVNRILNLAELAGYIERNPLPRGWLPKPLPRKLWAVLYPAEDRALLAWNEERARAEGVEKERPGIPLCYRILYGFLHREGMRKSEATGLRWRAIDLVNGTVELDANKTDHARFWRLDAGVFDALKAWRKLRGNPGLNELVFVDEAGAGFESEHMAGTLRAHMAAAGLDRPALFDKGDLKGRFGLHSFRRSFVTRGLATGRGEDWVRVRSGHKSSELLRYRQGAKALADLDAGEVDPLASTLPELVGFLDPVTETVTGPEKPNSENRVSNRKNRISEGGGTGRRTSLRC